MTDYKPTYRRPIADLFRTTADGAVRLCVRCGIHPDVVSYMSVVAAAGAGFCFWLSGTHPFLLIVGPAFCYLRLWFNMLDGMVALASGKASPHGEIINDLPDRVSDILIFVGVAHSGLNEPALGYWAALMAVMTAYVGITGQAVGVQREFSGVMAKPYRMVALHVGAWFAFMGNDSRFSGGATTMDGTLFFIILGCAQTIWVRLARIMKALKVKAAKR